MYLSQYEELFRYDMCMYAFLQNYVHKWMNHPKGCLEIIKSTSWRIHQVHKWMSSLICPQVDGSSQMDA